MFLKLKIYGVINNKKQIVHGDRVRYYDDSKLNVSEDIKAQFSHDNFSYEVNEFNGSRVNPIT